MRLSEFSVRNFRSITSQVRVSLGDQTTLVGPNNEGKSNLLRAMALGMDLVEGWSAVAPSLAARHRDDSGLPTLALRRRRDSRTSAFDGDRGLSWDWERDYPLAKQGVAGAKPTLLRLRFELSEEELTDFHRYTGIRCNGELPVELKLTKGRVTLGIVKQGRGAASYQAKAREIAEFIAERIEFVYVQAVRTFDQARLLVNELVRERISELSESQEYLELLDKLSDLQRAAIVPLQESLTRSVKNYLPAISTIEVEQADIRRSASVGDLIVDDGVRTSLMAKGDGVKSLLTMALIHELSSMRHANRTLVLAVDEPEAHLHPKAIHELDGVFRDFSSRQQVILATHNPIFVNRTSIRSNVLVERNATRVATSVSQIRAAIGVQIQDNLESAELTVLVEGHTDATILPHLLSIQNPIWARPSQRERIVFKATTGTGKLPVFIQREKTTICRIIAVLDNDSAGRQQAENVKSSNLIPSDDIFLLGLPGKRDSELEDVLNPDAYIDALKEHFGRPFSARHFANATKKWSDNFLTAANALGVAGGEEQIVRAAKVAVAAAVTGCSDSSLVLRSAASETVDSLSYLLTRALS